MADVGNALSIVSEMCLKGVLSSKIRNQDFEMFLICLSHGALHVSSGKINQGKKMGKE